MRRAAAVFLAGVMLLGSGVNAFDTENKAEGAYSPEGQKLQEYLSIDLGKPLIQSSYYGYMNFIENFKTNGYAMYALELADALLETGAEPDKEEYMEILTHVITIYDMENAADAAEQKKMDNLKSLEDYGGDLLELGADALKTMTGSGSSAGSLSEEISDAVGSLNMMAADSEAWAEGLADLEIMIADYSAYDEFLELISEQSEGELKAAASTLRSGMKEAMEIRLDTCQNLMDETFKNYGAEVFSSDFLQFLMKMPEYEEGAPLQWVAEAGLTAAEIAGGSSWALGKDIGKLVGNTVIGGEDLINRVREMMALYDISRILQDELLEISSDFVDCYGTETEEEQAKRYAELAQYLISCRMRGEYCLSSIVAEDAGLVAWFNRQMSRAADEWYEEQADAIEGIKDRILEITGGGAAEEAESETEQPGPEQSGLGPLSPEQLEYIKKILNVPDDLPVEANQSEAYYWEGAGLWLIYVEFRYQGEPVASVEADAYTGEPLADFWMYTPPDSLTSQPEPEETEQAHQGPYSDEELCEMARVYYEARYSEAPPGIQVDRTDGDLVMIHLYESMDDHLATYDWYTVDRNTAEGVDILGDPIDLKNP